MILIECFQNGVFTIIVHLYTGASGCKANTFNIHTCVHTCMYVHTKVQLGTFWVISGITNTQLPVLLKWFPFFSFMYLDILTLVLVEFYFRHLSKFRRMEVR